MLKVCLTGATGFIGKNLLKSLQTREDIEVIALSRKISPEMNNAKKGNTTWRRCNGFSLIEVEQALEGADILVYLIHSMLPTTTLSQGSFQDFDLYLADNFSKACKTNKVKKIIYLSGLIPDETELSNHLLSRLEVEKVLSQYNNNLTVLRAGLIIGKNGSSFRILERLIKRLPILICPRWTLNKTQPIELSDVLTSLEYSIDNYSEESTVYDIAGPDIITYKEMLALTAKVLNKKRIILDIPLLTPGLSKLWVSRVTSTYENLVYPLIESLRHNMLARPNHQLLIPNHNYSRFIDALKKGINPNDQGWFWQITNYSSAINFRWLENVTSIQRVKSTRALKAEEISELYFNWLQNFLKPFLFVKKDNDEVHFTFLKKITLLKLFKSNDRSDENRHVFYIIGGLLSKKEGGQDRLEFRTIPSHNCSIISLLDYSPSLPWFIYKYTQALFHLFVMKSFIRYLAGKK